VENRLVEELLWLRIVKRPLSESAEKVLTTATCARRPGQPGRYRDAGRSRYFEIHTGGLDEGNGAVTVVRDAAVWPPAPGGTANVTRDANPGCLTLGLSLLIRSVSGRYEGSQCGLCFAVMATRRCVPIGGF
jgi:hypothetical protein